MQAWREEDIVVVIDTTLNNVEATSGPETPSSFPPGISSLGVLALTLGAAGLGLVAILVIWLACAARKCPLRTPAPHAYERPPRDDVVDEGQGRYRTRRMKQPSEQGLSREDVQTLVF